MTVVTLDHVHIRTGDVARTAAFFRDVLGLRAEPAPGAGSIAAACWVYDPQGRPIVHVGRVEMRYPSDDAHPFDAASGGGSVHHVAFECVDLPETTARLDAAGLAYTVNPVPAAGLTQIFVAEENGILLELNFRDAAVGA